MEFYDLLIISGSLLEPLAPMFQHFRRVFLLTLFAQASGTALRRLLADSACHFGAFARGFWAGVESVIFDDATMYNRHFEGPGGCKLASFGHCFFRGHPGAHFL